MIKALGAIADGMRDAGEHEDAAYLDRAAAALEAAREDAERYRWLRDPCSGAERVIFYCRGDYGKGLMSGTMLDAAIDQARGKGGQEVGK